MHDTLRIEGLGDQIQAGSSVLVRNLTKAHSIETQHLLSARQCEILASGGLINWVKLRNVDSNLGTRFAVKDQ